MVSRPYFSFFSERSSHEVFTVYKYMLGMQGRACVPKSIEKKYGSVR